MMDDQDKAGQPDAFPRYKADDMRPVRAGRPGEAGDLVEALRQLKRDLEAEEAEGSS